MTKPAFGDVRGPWHWIDTADKALVQDVALLKHELDGCIYISVRLATESDHDFAIFEMDGQSYMSSMDLLEFMWATSWLVAKEFMALKTPKNHMVTDPAALLNVYTCCCTGSNLVPWSTTINRHSVEHTWNRAWPDQRSPSTSRSTSTNSNLWTSTRAARCNPRRRSHHVNNLNYRDFWEPWLGLPSRHSPTWLHRCHWCNLRLHLPTSVTCWRWTNSWGLQKKLQTSTWWSVHMDRYKTSDLGCTVTPVGHHDLMDLHKVDGWFLWPTLTSSTVASPSLWRSSTGHPKDSPESAEAHFQLRRRHWQWPSTPRSGSSVSLPWWSGQTKGLTMRRSCAGLENPRASPMLERSMTPRSPRRLAWNWLRNAPPSRSRWAVSAWLLQLVCSTAISNLLMGWQNISPTTHWEWHQRKWRKKKNKMSKIFWTKLPRSSRTRKRSRTASSPWSIWMKNTWKNVVSVCFLDVDWLRKRARSTVPNDTTMPTNTRSRPRWNLTSYLPLKVWCGVWHLPHKSCPGLHDHRNPGVHPHRLLPGDQLHADLRLRHLPDLWHPDCLPHWHAWWTSRSTTATPISSLYRPRMARMAKLARMTRSWRSLSGTKTRGSNRSKLRTWPNQRSWTSSWHQEDDPCWDLTSGPLWLRRSRRQRGQREKRGICPIATPFHRGLYLTQEQIDKIINGEMDAPSVPMHPEEWDGIGRAQRDAMMNVLEDALMLGLDYEEMDAATAREARKIRAELNHIRSTGRDIEIQRISHG